MKFVIRRPSSAPAPHSCQAFALRWRLNRRRRSLGLADVPAKPLRLRCGRTRAASRAGPAPGPRRRSPGRTTERETRRSPLPCYNTNRRTCHGRSKFRMTTGSLRRNPGERRIGCNQKDRWEVWARKRGQSQFEMDKTMDCHRDRLETLHVL